MLLSIEDDIIQALKAPEPKAEEVLRQTLAVSLYAKNLLPLGPARKLAGVSRWEFEDLLVRERVVRNYSLDDLREDSVLAHSTPPPDYRTTPV